MTFVLKGNGGPRHRVEDLPSSALPVILALHEGVAAALESQFVGLYLRGSLALGGFDPSTSDIDFLVVTERPVDDAEFARLASLHERLAASGYDHASELEGSYLDRRSLWQFAPGDGTHPSIGVDWAFQRRVHRANWTMECAVVRERGVVIAGPDPFTLIAPIGPEALRAAVHSELQARFEDWATTTGVPGWLLPRKYQAFEVETLCRALFTLARGGLPTKPEAVAWARTSLPERWRTLVAESQRWRADRTPDETGVEEIKAFARWAASREWPGS